MANTNTDTPKSLPELLKAQNTLRNKLEYDLGIDSNQMLAKSLLGAAADTIKRNSDAYRQHLEKVYREESKQNPDLKEDQFKTSAEFDVIMNHLSDFVKENSNSSVFERSDKLKIMDYIQKSIKKADIDEKEKKELLKQYEYASKSIKNVTGIFDKASNLFSRTLINSITFITSVFSDLPPAWGWLLAKGGDALSNMLEKRKTKQERMVSLEYDIDEEKRNRQAALDEAKNEGEKEEEPEKSKPEKPKSNFAESKMERIQDTSGSLLDKAPTGSESDPFFVKITDKSLFKKEEKDKNPILAALAGILGGFADKITGALGKLGALLGLAKDGKLAGTAAKTAKDLLDGKDIPDKEGKNGKKGAKANEKSVFKRLASGVKTAAKGAMFLGGAVGGGAALGYGLYELSKLSQEKYNKATEDLRKHGYDVDKMQQDAIDREDDMFAGLEHLKGQDLNVGKFEQKKNPEDGVVNESKDSSRASVGTQIDAATQARINANEEKRAQQIQLNQSNNSTVINNYNKTTNQNNARIVQVTNPQAQLVHGSR